LIIPYYKKRIDNLKMIGIIYKISNTEDIRLYVGSTFGSINQRFSQHKLNAKSEDRTQYNGVLYVAMIEIGIDKFKIEVIETVECEDKNELHQYEQNHIDRLEPEFNFQRACHTAETREAWRKAYEERRIANRTPEETLANTDRVKKWHTDNKEHIKEYKKQLYLKKKAEIQAKHKTYYQENKEHLKAKAKENAKKNPKTTITCECGSNYKQGQKTRHLKTDKHKNYEEEKNMTEEEKEVAKTQAIETKEIEKKEKRRQRYLTLGK